MKNEDGSISLGMEMNPLTITVVVMLIILVTLIVTGRIPLIYNIRNLFVRWKTSVMTALAFTLVIALLTVMLAFVNGMTALTEQSGQPGNVIILADGVTDESFSNLGFSDIGDIETQPGIVKANGIPLCSRETYLVVNQPLPNAQEGRPKRRFVQLRGVDDPVTSGKVHGLELLAGGQWFSDAGVQANSEKDASGNEQDSLIQAVIGEGVARVMAGDRTEEQNKSARDPEKLTVGDSFILGGRTWMITGVIKSSGSTFDSEVWAKRAVVGPIFGKATYSSLVVRTADATSAVTVKDFFNNDYKKAAVSAQIETEYFNGLSQTNQQFLVAIQFVTAVMALGGILGVMNTMFAAVSQRIGDIGVLRLLGFSRRQILISFLLESLLLSLAGGVLGCALGSLADGWTANSIVSSGQGGGKFVVLQLQVDWQTLMIGMGIAIGMGLFGGLIPAWNAFRLKPLEALR
ncbi:MAG: ABC transporter permease [Planctomycetaceae bacterium]